MSIVTRTGDKGSTGLMYNRRVPKADPRVEACGTVDELNAALGLARATSQHPQEAERLLSIQRDLVPLMGELATAEQDRARYVKDGLPVLEKSMTSRLELWVREIEGRSIEFRGWAMPGANLHSAALDLARAVCRRAERRVCELQETGQLPNQEIIVYLNRLSDLLWLMARLDEAQP